MAAGTPDLVLESVGTVAFAVSGGAVAVRAGMDWPGPGMTAGQELPPWDRKARSRGAREPCPRAAACYLPGGRAPSRAPPLAWE